MSLSATADEITLHVVPEFNEYLRFTRWASRRQIGRVRLFGWLGIIVFALSPLIPYEVQGAADRYRASLFLLIFPALLFVVIPLLVYVSAKSRWKQVPEVHEPRTFVFSKEGIAFSSATVRSDSSWNLIRRAHEAVGHILLETGQHTFYLVPLRAFESPERLDRFRALVAMKVQSNDLRV
jgi:hypothetical protein